MFNFEKEIKDLNLINRDINLFGKVYVEKLKKLKILVYGLRPLGVEIITNLSHYSPNQLAIWDENNVNIQDLGASSCYKESDVDTRLRQDVCMQYLRQINSKLNVKIEDGYKLNSQELLHQFDLVIISDVYDFKLLQEINDICRQKKPQATGLIYAGQLGLYSFLFQDFGTDFKINDRDGEDVYPYLITNITKSDPGVVTIHKDKPHNFQNGDFICINEVQGMKEVNGNEARPIKIKNEYEFTIEDTSDYQPYQKNGLVQIIKVPFRKSFQSFADYMKNPIFNQQIYQDEEGKENMIFWHQILQSVFRFYEQNKQLPKKNDQEHASLFSKICLEVFQENQENENLKFNQEKIDKQLIHNFGLIAENIFQPLSVFTGALVSKETVAFVGKYSPINQIFHINEMRLFPNDNSQLNKDETELDRYSDIRSIFGNQILQKIKDFKVAVIGSGANGCEVLRILSLLGVSAGGKGKIFVVDDAEIKKFNINVHPWIGKEELNKNKAEVACLKCKEINGQINIEAKLERASIKNNDHLDENFWSSLDLIINSSDKIDCRHYLFNKSIWFEKPLFDQKIQGLKAITQILVPFETGTEQQNLSSKNEFESKKENIFEFPYLPIHNIMWAKEQFVFFFVDTMKEISSLMKDPGLFWATYRNIMKFNPKYRTRVSIFKNILLDLEKVDLDILINYSREIYEFLYVTKINQLLNQHPPDEPGSENAFWIGYKRLPYPLHYQSMEQNSSHNALKFITISTIILAQIFNIDFNIEEKSTYVQQKLKQMYEKDQRPPYFQLEKELSDKEVENIISELSDLENFKCKNINVGNLNFEGDHLRSYYIEFLDISANIRAKCYTLQSIQKHLVEIVAFENDRTCPLTQSISASILSFELMNLLQKRKREDYRQCELDLAINKCVNEPPCQPKKHDSNQDPDTVLIPSEFTEWDKLRIYGRQTINTLINNFYEKDNIILTNILAENQLVWDQSLENQEQILDKTPAEVYKELVKNGTVGKSALELALSAKTNEGKQCIFAKVKYNIGDGE
ncbi:Molybdenum cofactor biosynthesis, MoeB [Pseudocohnilembus persalinus]|uniref:Molybdenum cofactor biosynthesis, MoeB n=1 Tax=Pseudocohnilembus persalinus TaxID=266149 RepID=A0A0V0QA19_PSEPJ|nr:Molybdenum cofactor biosynthesis, MoeB [Pseudocohnilembus persalinus]|eukprot:KRW99025.1 Molybdenum cofactor biosynthesis, MoeB [Pseudocohnilembus persalinus]